MTRKPTKRRAHRPMKRAARPIPAAQSRNPTAISGVQAPGDEARVTIRDGLLALADRGRHAEHKDAAQAVAEGVTLAGIAAARNVLEQDADARARHPSGASEPADSDFAQLRCADLRGWSNELDTVLNELVHLGSAASRTDGGYAADAIAAAVTIQYVRDELRHAVEHPREQVSP